MFFRFRILRMLDACPLLVDANSPAFIQKVLSYVPSDIRVPHRRICARLPREMAASIEGKEFKFFTKKPEFDVSLHPCYDQLTLKTGMGGPDLLIRRRNPAPNGDIDDARYPEYDIGQTTVLAIAFMLPSNFVPEESVAPHLFEHVPGLKDIKWPLRSICGFFPGLFEVVRFSSFETRMRSLVSAFESTTRVGASSAIVDEALQSMAKTLENKFHQGMPVPELSATLTREQKEELQKVFPNMTAVFHNHNKYFSHHKKKGFVFPNSPKPRPVPITCTYYSGPKWEQVETWLAHATDAHIEASAAPSGFTELDSSSKIPASDWARSNPDTLAPTSDLAAPADPDPEPPKTSGAAAPRIVRDLRKDPVTQEDAQRVAELIHTRLPPIGSWVNAHAFIICSIDPNSMDVVRAHKIFPILFMRDFPKLFRMEKIDDQPMGTHGLGGTPLGKLRVTRADPEPDPKRALTLKTVNVAEPAEPSPLVQE